MSEARNYGVECKTPDCHTGIVIGSYFTRPERAGDMISFVIVKKAGRVKCPNCGKDHEYDQSDIREFPPDVQLV